MAQGEFTGVREERGVNAGHHEAGHHLAHCKECDRFFDVRSGCPGDIRDDERARAVKLAEEMIAATPSGMRSYDNSDRCDSRREALREFARRLKKGR